MIKTFRKLALFWLVFTLAFSNIPFFTLRNAGFEKLAEKTKLPEAEAAAAEDAHAYYMDSTLSSPNQLRTRRYTATTWEAESTANQTTNTTINNVIVEASPTRDEKLIGVWSDTGTASQSEIRVFRWNGGTGDETLIFSTTIPADLGTNIRPFDIAYEYSSGDAVIAYSNGGTTNELSYVVWNGTATTTPVAVALNGTTAAVCGVQLAPYKGTSDRIAMAYTVNATTNSVNGAVWNGSGWESNPSTPLETGALEPGTACNSMAFDVAVEDLSKEPMAVWGRNGVLQFAYSSCTGGPPCTWGAAALGGNEDATVIAVSARSGTDELFTVYSGNAGNDTSGSFWSGSTWTHGAAGLDATNGDPDVTLGQQVAVGWLQSGSNVRALGIYSDAAAAGVDFVMWNGSAISLGADICTAGAATLEKQIVIKPYAFSSQGSPGTQSSFVMLKKDVNADIFSYRINFDGTGFSCNILNNDGLALNANVGVNTNRAFDFDHDRFLPPGSLTIGVTVPSQVATLSSGDANQFASVATCGGTGTCAAFSLTTSGGPVTLTSIKLTETGTVSAANDLSNFALYIDNDAALSNGVVAGFGNVATSTGETVTFPGSYTIPSGNTYYAFVSFDLASPLPTSTARTYPKSGQTIDWQIAVNGDVTSNATGTSGAPVTLAGTTTVIPEADAITGITVGTDGRIIEDPTAVTSGDERVRGIASDESALYLIGDKYTGGECTVGSWCWRIEKRDKTTGALVAAFDTDGIVNIDPTSGDDEPYAITIDGNYIYVAGFQASGGALGGVTWRIEKRDKTTGALVTAFDGEGVVLSDPTSGADRPRAITLDAGYLYIGGDQATGGGCSTGGTCFRIEKRDKTTGALVTAFDGDGFALYDPTTGSDLFLGIAVDEKYVYATGQQQTGAGCTTGAVCWYMEKRDKITGALVSAFDTDGRITSDPTSGNDVPYEIVVDNSYLYVAGYDSGAAQWRIEKRNKTTGALCTAANCGTAFDTDGVVTSNPGGTDVALDIAQDATSIYIVGNEAGGTGCAVGLFCWRIEKRDKATGALVTAFDGDGAVQADLVTGDEEANVVTVDSGYVYVGGYMANGNPYCTALAGNACWRVEKYRIDNGSATATFGDTVNAGDSVTIGGYGFGAPAAGADRQDCTTAAVDKGCVKFASSTPYTVLNSDITSWTNTQIVFVANNAAASASGVNIVEVRAANQADATKLTLIVIGVVGGTVTIGVTAGSKATTLNSGDANQFANTLTCAASSTCSAFTLSLSSGSDTVTSIKLTETGTVTAANDLSNLALYYEASDSNFLNGGLTQYGSGVATSTQETVTFSGSLALTAGTTYYVYLSFDLKSQLPTSTTQTFPKGGQTVNWQIAANGDVTVSGGSSISGAPVTLAGTTTVLPDADAIAGMTVGSDGIVQSDPTSGSDVPLDIVVDSQYMYVVGGQATGAGCATGSLCWRIEKRDKTTGALVTSFDGDGVVQSDATAQDDEAEAVAVDSGYLYIVGYEGELTGECAPTAPGDNKCSRIEKRDKTTGALVTAFDGDGIVVSDPTTDTEIFSDVAVDSQYVYVAGQQATGAGCATGGPCWRIEKRDKTTGALVTAFDGDGIAQSDPTSGADAALILAIDSQYVYVAGQQATGAGCATGGTCWRIEKRDKTTGALVTAFDGDGFALSDPTSGTDQTRDIAVDSQYMYVSGYQATGAGCATGLNCWRIEKRDKTTGALVTAFGSPNGYVQSDPTSGDDQNRGIAVDSQYMYVSGYQATGAGCATGGNCWRIEKRDKTTGALVTAFDGDGIAQSDPTSGDDQNRGIAVDSQYMYVSGYQATGAGCATGGNCWRIEKRDKTTGALVTAFDGDGIAQSDPTSGADAARLLAIDSQYLYVEGWQATGAGCATGSDCWRIEKRRLDNGTTTVTFGDGARSGDSITVSGYGFGAPTAGANREDCTTATVDRGCIKFTVGGTTNVANADITSWTNASTTFTVATTLASDGGASNIEMRAANQADATKLTFYVYPTISAIAVCTDCTANSAREHAVGVDTDGLIMLSGDHFGSSAATSTILSVAATVHATVEGPCTVGSWTTTSICLEVPTAISDSLYTGDILMQRSTDGKSATSTNFRILPRITSNANSVGGADGVIGQLIQINGNHFCQGGCPSSPNRSTAADNVKFGSTQALDSDFVDQFDFIVQNCFELGADIAWSNDYICVKVPAGTPPGSASTTVTSNTYLSNAKAFTRASTVPSDPTDLKEFEANGSTQMGVGSTTASSTVVLKADLAATLAINMALQIEATSTANTFACSGTSTCSVAVEGTVGGGGACTSCTSLNDAQVTVSNLSDNTYHWQARVRNTTTNEHSNWVSFPTPTPNAETATDFKVDTAGPAITNISSGTPLTNSATITWDTSGESSTSQVQYNKTGTFVTNCATNNDCTTLADPAPPGVFSHSVALPNLDSGTLYYYRVRSKDAAGNETISGNNTFTTASVTRPGKTTMFFITGITGTTSGGSTATSSFSVFVPEATSTVKSAFVEITAQSASGGTNNFQVQVNSQASKTYAINAASRTHFKVLYEVTPANLNLNDTPTSNTLSVAPSLDTNIISAKVIVTYAFTP